MALTKLQVLEYFCRATNYEQNKQVGETKAQWLTRWQKAQAMKEAKAQYLREKNTTAYIEAETEIIDM